jgi:hypothetical protein
MELPTAKLAPNRPISHLFCVCITVSRQLLVVQWWLDMHVLSFQVAEMYRSQVNSIKASSSSSNAATDDANDDMY